MLYSDSQDEVTTLVTNTESKRYSQKGLTMVRHIEQVALESCVCVAWS